MVLKCVLVAVRTLLTALGLYGRHFVLLTAFSLVPALARAALFLEVSWMSGLLSGAAELIVVGFRVTLLFVALGLVWPRSPDHPRRAVPDNRSLSSAQWVTVACQVILLALFSLILNAAVNGVAGIVAADQSVQTALSYALKNLFIIPFWIVHLLVAIRTTLKG